MPVLCLRTHGVCLRLQLAEGSHHNASGVLTSAHRRSLSQAVLCMVGCLLGALMVLGCCQGILDAASEHKMAVPSSCCYCWSLPRGMPLHFVGP